ncbi:MAG: MiaB/RimO family radical SAM methylthiotransferase [Desulfovibrio sp.]|jgi:MiaB/RimO family radical SAM methylthiotransferase|nr:MiaB/RimO family radical SAM methylthiotransferase [Desulfovibrio sp.]
MPHFPANKTFHVATLGCKINQYESEAIAEAWRGKGFAEADDAAGAGVLLVNSCAVTGRAVSDLRALVRRLRLQNPAARIVVTGCAAQVLSAELSAMPEVDEVVPQDRKAALLSGPLFAPAPPAAAAVPRGFPPFRIGSFRRARAVVKVQDGCSHHCTYCIVPLTRGGSVSRDPAEAVDEMRRLLDAGYRELVLSGVNLRQYGADLPQPLDFWDLLARVEAELAPQWAGRARLRLSSVEPGQLGAKALDVLGASRLVAPHLHLSLQSGDAAVLRRMGRGHYRPEQVREFLTQLARFWPRLGLGADLLTGFPGETEEQFENSYAFCRELPLTYAHVFPYSPRPGTAASRLADPLPKAERTARAARLRGMIEAKKRAFQKELAAQPRLTVLVESADSGQGVCEFYAACRVESAPGVALRAGGLVRARPVEIAGGRIVCAALGEGAPA